VKTKISSGKLIDITAPSGGCTSGVGVLIGKLFGIALLTVIAGDITPIDTEGCFDHAAEGAGSGQAWGVGDVVYWDNTNKRLTKTSTDNTRVGVAVEVKATAATTGRLRLDGVVA